MGLRSALERRLGTEDVPPDAWEPLLRMASAAYRVLVDLRSRLYDRRFGVRFLPAPVISVGNLRVGGTGKTPLVAFLAAKLRDQGLKVAVLSRGYGRRKGPAILQVSAGAGAMVPVEMAGDEPHSLARCVHGVSVWVGKRRIEVGLKAWAQERPDVFLLDDGFQHRSLHRDLDVVVARLPRPWGNSRLIPAGPLREPWKGLTRAHLLVITGCEATEEMAEGAELAKFAIPTVRAWLKPEALRPLGGHRVLDTHGIRGRRVGLVCAIGDPRIFALTVKGLGAEVGPCLFFRDHHWYTHKDVRLIGGLLREAELIMTTEKDAGKLEAIGMEMDSIMALRVTLELQPEQLLNELLEDVVPMSPRFR